MELMTVVVIIGIMTVLAAPTMRLARMDRHVYDDAASIADFIREARAHAIGRGAAVLVRLESNGNAGNMIYTMSEAVGPNPGTTPAPAADNRVPIASCKTPTRWAATALLPSNANLLRTIDWSASDSYETTNGISARMVLADASTPTIVQICFTPSGRSFMVTGATANFDAQGPMTQGIEINVTRKDGGVVQGLTRTVVIPPTGVTRVRSQ